MPSGGNTGGSGSGGDAGTLDTLDSLDFIKKDGSVAMTGAFNQAQGTDIASAGTINLDTATGNLIDVTGTTTITAITLSQGRQRIVRFTGALTLTNGASLVLPGAANITTAAGDYAVFTGYAAGVVRCVAYANAITNAGRALIDDATAAAQVATLGFAADATKLQKHGADVVSAGTIDLDAATGALIDVTGTTTITAITLADGLVRVVRFTGILTLTHGASLVLPGAANITTAAGDMAVFAGYAAGVVRCVSYVKANGQAVVSSGGDAATLDGLDSLAFVKADGSVAMTGALVLPIGSTTSPTLTFTGDTNNGFSAPNADEVHFIHAGVAKAYSYGGGLFFASDVSLGWTSNVSAPAGGQDLFLRRDAANVLAQRNGTTAQEYRVYNTLSGADGDFLRMSWSANVAYLTTSITGSGTYRGLRVGVGGGSTSLYLHTAGADKWEVNTTGHLLASTDGANDIGATGATRPRNLFLASPAITVGSGTGVTVDDSGSVRRVTYKVTVTYAALAAAATTADKTIATLPAKTRIVAIIADTTIKYIGGAVSAATLIVGKTVGGNEYIVSHDVFTAAVTKGLADADLGTSINRASAIQGGDLASWSGTTAISVRLTTTSANTNALTQGSTAYYIITEQYA